MTLREAKDQVAKDIGFESWLEWHRQAYETTGNPNVPEGFHDRVAELYARSKWNEACDHYHSILIDRLESETHVTFVPPKPEFKP